MDKRVEGVYVSVDKALKAVDRLRGEGYTSESIVLVANEDVRSRLTSTSYADVATHENEVEDKDQSFWESIKDAFTTNSSDDDNPKNDPVYEHRDALKEGQIVILLKEKTQSIEQPNTVGPDGTRGLEDEQEMINKRGERLDFEGDHERSRDELEDYERRQ